MKNTQYKQIINKFITGISVITGCYGRKYFGITANSLNSVSLNPTLIAFNIAKDANSLDLMQNVNFFNINILAEDQKKLAHIFANSEDDKFAKVNFSINEHNCPILVGNQALLTVKKQQIIKAGDHYIFICEVISGKQDINKKPLKYFNSEIF